MIVNFITRTRLGRAILPRLHRFLHPSLPEGGMWEWRFGGSDPCRLCRAVVRETWRKAPPEMFDALADQSQVPVEELLGELDLPEGKRIVMSATVKRQLERMAAEDPSTLEAFRAAAEQIAKDHWGPTGPHAEEMK